MGAYAEAYQRALNDPHGYWADAAAAVDWMSPWTTVLDDSNPPFYRWFSGATLNTCYNAVDRHVEAGRGDQLAIIHDSPVTDSISQITFRQLQDQVARFAGALRGQGVAHGDRVIIYMPMVPEAVIAMLACARIGAVHSVVFGGFAANELAHRIDDCKPKVVVSASCGIEPSHIVAYKPLLDRAIEMAEHKVGHCIVLQRARLAAEMKPGRDLGWDEAMAGAEPADCVPVQATDPLYILYTSGTTGQPKGIVRDNGGHAVAMAWSMRNIYDVAPGEVFWAASDVGWVVGHSYVVYAPLINGSTTVVYEGKPVGTPDPGAFWRVISQHRVAAMFTAPTAFRAIRKQDPAGEHIGRYDLSRFRTLFLAGERCDPDTLAWAQETLRVPVIDHWWQTETGWAIAANCCGLEAMPVKAGSPTVAVPGYDVQILDDDGATVADGQSGNIAIKLPLPPGTLASLWHADDRFRTAYLDRYPGYYLTGDSGLRDSDGYLHIMSRIDDVINVAGHRLSTGSIEEVLASHPQVAECAVFGINDSIKGQVPMGLVVLKDGGDADHELIRQELITKVRLEIGAVAAFKQVGVVDRLPKTRSGKILRGIMQKIANGEKYKQPATIDDPEILIEIKNYLTSI